MENTEAISKRELIEGMLSEHPRFIQRPDEATAFGLGVDAGMGIAILKIKEFLSEMEDWLRKPGPPIDPTKKEWQRMSREALEALVCRARQRAYDTEEELTIATLREAFRVAAARLTESAESASVVKLATNQNETEHHYWYGREREALDRAAEFRALAEEKPRAD